MQVMCEAVAHRCGSCGAVGLYPQVLDLGSRWHWLVLVLLLLLPPGGAVGHVADNPLLIDDFSRADRTSALGTRWRAVSDQVMGGVSEARLVHRQAETACISAVRCGSTTTEASSRQPSICRRMAICWMPRLTQDCG